MIIAKKHAAAFSGLRDAIEVGVAARHQVPAAPPPSTSAVSVADELGKLAALHATGARTDDEFAAHKAKLLG